MIDINELRRLAQAVSGWSNCNQAWLDQSEDVQAAVVGHIDEDGNTYPVATIDCDRYYAAHQSLPLAKFYAAANPAAITELLDRLEAAEKDIAIKEEVIDSLAAVVKRLDAQCDAAEAEAIEQARLNGMGSEREAALLSKLEAAEKERDELRAKVAGLVPIGLLHVGGYYGEELEDWEFEADQQACDRLNEAHFQREATLNLYALPCVKGEEK